MKIQKDSETVLRTWDKEVFFCLSIYLLELRSGQSSGGKYKRELFRKYWSNTSTLHWSLVEVANPAPGCMIQLGVFGILALDALGRACLLQSSIPPFAFA